MQTPDGPNITGGISMLAQAVDFQAEADEVQTLLATLGASDWERATLFKAWTVNDIVQHLHDGDLMAAASVVGPESFARRRTGSRRSPGRSRSSGSCA